MQKIIIHCDDAVAFLRDAGLEIGKETLMLGLQQHVFPFGDYIRAPEGRKDRYLIYTRLLEDWAAARSPYVK